MATAYDNNAIIDGTPAAVFYAGRDAWYHGREPLAVMPCY